MRLKLVFPGLSQYNLLSVQFTSANLAEMHQRARLFSMLSETWSKTEKSASMVLVAEPK